MTSCLSVVWSSVEQKMMESDYEKKLLELEVPIVEEICQKLISKVDKSIKNRDEPRTDEEN